MDAEVLIILVLDKSQWGTHKAQGALYALFTFQTQIGNLHPSGCIHRIQDDFNFVKWNWQTHNRNMFFLTTHTFWKTMGSYSHSAELSLFRRSRKQCVHNQKHFTLAIKTSHFCKSFPGLIGIFIAAFCFYQRKGVDAFNPLSFLHQV